MYSESLWQFEVNYYWTKDTYPDLIGKFIASMLVDMYAKCEYLLDACMVFDKSKHDGISWNALITGLLDCGYSSHVGKCI